MIQKGWKRWLSSCFILFKEKYKGVVYGQVLDRNSLSVEIKPAAAASFHPKDDSGWKEGGMPLVLVPLWKNKSFYNALSISSTHLSYPSVVLFRHRS